ncbi:hypothetical protein ABRQ05_18685 [Pectobacterium actinidiae]|uniref:hypothetical protein n=1 Tax=Pectobacterium actinidiae TaxID=1507808 RepID=UPI0032EBCD0C
MDTKLDAVKDSTLAGYNEYSNVKHDVKTALHEKKYYRLFCLGVLVLVMTGLILFVKPLLVAYLTQWIIGILGGSHTVGIIGANCVGSLLTTQVRKILKYWVLKINK